MNLPPNGLLDQNQSSTLPYAHIVRRARAYENDRTRGEHHYAGLSQHELELFWEAVNTIRGFWEDQDAA